MFNECLDIGWKTAHFCILNFSFKNEKKISNIRYSVSSPDETPRSSSKILRYASYFQLSSRCFFWWWNTASHVWYITWRIMQIEEDWRPRWITSSEICIILPLNNQTYNYQVYGAILASFIVYIIFFQSLDLEIIYNDSPANKLIWQNNGNGLLIHSSEK